MNMHTPGPWKATCNHDALYIHRGNTGGYLIDGETSDQNHADAQLIAAAPEMYESLKKAKKTLELLEMKIAGTPAGLDEVRTAIAKAEGKEVA